MNISAFTGRYYDLSGINIGKPSDQRCDSSEWSTCQASPANSILPGEINGPPANPWERRWPYPGGGFKLPTDNPQDNSMPGPGSTKRRPAKGESTGAVVPGTHDTAGNSGVDFSRLTDMKSELERRARAARNPADNVQPNDPIMEWTTDYILNIIAEKYGSGEGTPTQRLSSMSMEELDAAVREEFAKLAVYRPDTEGDQWTPVDREYYHLDSGVPNFIGDCEDLSFKLASVMQNVHARRYRQIEGMDTESAMARSAQNVFLLGTEDHMMVGVQNEDGYTSLHDPNGMLPTLKIKLSDHAEELGICFRANAGEVVFFAEDFDMAAYEPGSWSQVTEEERQRLYESIGKSLSQCSALVPGAQGLWAIPDALFNPFGIWTTAKKFAVRAYNAVYGNTENRAEPVPVDIDAEIARRNYEYFQFTTETQQADNPDGDGDDIRQSDVDEEVAQENYDNFEHTTETQQADNPATNSDGNDGGGSDSDAGGSGDAGDGADF